MAIILREAIPEVTLDDALLAVMDTFNNGCNFRVEVEGGEFYLDYGCYGVHVNLAQGKKALLVQWLGYEEEYTGRKILEVSPSTITEILSRVPCRECGGTRFIQETTNET